MTDLEREASEIVRDIIDACARAEGFKDLLEASDWSVDQRQFKDRIVRLAQLYSEQRIGWTVTGAPRFEPRTTELL